MFRSEYEIDWKTTGQLAIESNFELQEKYSELKKKYRRLKKEYKKLQVEHCRVLFDMEAIIDEKINEKLKNV